MDIPDFSKLKGPQFTEKHFSFHYPEFLKLLNSKYPDDISFQEKLYLYQHNLIEPPKCPTCGGKLGLINARIGYKKYCSCKCMNSNPDKKAAIKNTNMERYGGPAPCSNKEIQAKMERTCMEKYGHRNALQVPTIKKKVFNTIIERYGGILGASEVLMEKARKTSLERYGVPSSSQCPEVKAKVRATMLERYGVTNPCLLNPAGAAPSSQEYSIRSWLDEWNIPYTFNDRTILRPMELDIYIPSKQMAIECNGCYWHCDQEKPKNYHLKKFQDCKDRGIQLIQIWEDWMIRKPEVVKSFLQAKLGICNQTFPARKCQVREIDYRMATDFLEANHIQGKCQSNVRLGLFHQDRLVAVMCFNRRSGVSGSRVIMNSEVELIRFCNLKNTRVVGGAGKLLDYYIKHYHPALVTSFSSNDISNGQLYRSLGFTSDNKSSESYWYIEPHTFQRYHRSIFSRSGISDKWPEYKIDDKSWTERSVMDLKGYMRIYDAGTTCWRLMCGPK